MVIKTFVNKKTEEAFDGILITICENNQAFLVYIGSDLANRHDDENYEQNNIWLYEEDGWVVAEE
jgi:hypothetical protein